MVIKRVSPEFEQVLEKLKKQLRDSAGLELSDTEASRLLAKMADRQININSDTFINQGQSSRFKETKRDFDFKL